MSDCVFCKIIEGTIPSSKIYEDDKTVAILNINPVSKGHALILPKKHSTDFLETEDSELQTSIVVVKKVAEAILKATGAAGFNIHVNTKPAAGQEIFHLHYHIIPRYQNDGLKVWPHAEAEPKTREQMAEEIKKFIK
ncbi:MAG TPA: HIT family protein [Verrucomicrobiae bacterium]|nr:HIT family protein [Verrucomicrobiae bacterium]